MTLGYGPPRATCPQCLNEGSVADDQHKHTGSHGRLGGPPLRRQIRFCCENGHEWLALIDDALLMGAFLDRQPA